MISEWNTALLCKTWLTFLVAALLRGAMVRTLGAPPSARYISLLKELYRVNLSNPVKMGLQNTQRLNELLGDPLGKVPIIHVAGTNGKGSVCLKTADALRRCGLRTGLFVSPHISSFRERIQVNGMPISEEEVETLLPQLFELSSRHNIPATFFELTTLLSFMSFGKAKCDAVVLEVGLGGRLDSTNIVTPALSVITSIQLDHTKILGDTVEQIALEKAGIMKPNVPVLVGPGCPQQVMKQRALEVGAPYYTVETVLPRENRAYRQAKVDRISGSLVNEDIDDLNVDISRAALMLLQQHGPPVFGQLSPSNSRNSVATHIEAGLSSRPPCRYQLLSSPGNVDVVLDIAHNEDAITALVGKLRTHYPYPTPLRVVLGMSADKDVGKCVGALAAGLFGKSVVNVGSDNRSPAAPARMGEAVSRVHCTAAHHPRALAGQELQNVLRSVCSESGSGSGSEFVADQVPAVLPVSEALHQALTQCRAEVRDIKAKKGVVVVCGTFFIMSEARAALGIVEPRDGDFLADGVRDVQENFAEGVNIEKVV